MKALVFHGPKDLRYESFDDPKISQDRSLIIQVKKCSICGSDLHMYHGDRIGSHDYSKPMDHFCTGHETIGEVVEVDAAVEQVNEEGDAHRTNQGLGKGVVDQATLVLGAHRTRGCDEGGRHPHARRGAPGIAVVPCHLPLMPLLPDCRDIQCLPKSHAFRRATPSEGPRLPKGRVGLAFG